MVVLVVFFVVIIVAITADDAEAEGKRFPARDGNLDPRSVFSKKRETRAWGNQAVFLAAFHSIVPRSPIWACPDIEAPSTLPW